MPGVKEESRRTMSLILALLLCAPAYGQQQDEKRRVPRTGAGVGYRGQEPSELSQENLKRGAASAGRIREVLIKDAGLLVELMRWVAKEATDNGQIVDDAS